jgi:hypothetical protein
MNSLEQVPEWIGTAILGGFLAALGYFGKALSEIVGTALDRRRARRARLAELLALIRAGDAAFETQQAVGGRLAELILKRTPELRAAARTYDHLFSLAYSTLTSEEKELFDIVRAYTVHTFKPLNDSLLRWLAGDVDFRIAPSGRSRRAKLAVFLADLEAHLLLWQAKYNAWMPDHPERALVYLADQSKHGLPFPRGGARIVQSVLSRTSLPSQPAEGARQRVPEDSP